MKKIRLFLVCLLLVAIAWTHTGCFGSFGLTKKAWEFNKNVGGKVAQEAVFLLMCIIPVYEFCTLVDAVILNLIEFWSGSNPLAMKAGEVQSKMMAFKGQSYKVTATQNKFIIEKKSENGFKMLGKLEYKNNSWYINSDNNEHKLIGFNGKGQVEFYTKDNNVYTLDKNQASPYMLKKMINENEAFTKK